MGIVDDRVCIVAGAGGGIGAAIATTLAQHGARVSVVDRHHDRAASVVASIEALGGTAMAAVCDVRVEEEFRGVVEATAERYGGVHALVNNAGGMTKHAPWRPLELGADSDWEMIMEINLGYAVRTCRVALPLLREAPGGGAIVNISSISGSVSAPRHAAYGAAKAGLENLTRTLAVECGPAVRVNAVAPGAIMTEAVSPRIGQDDQSRRICEATPLGRLGRAVDVAGGVTFFCSDLAAYVTGQVLVVDGGATVTYPVPLDQ